MSKMSDKYRKIVYIYIKDDGSIILRREAVPDAAAPQEVLWGPICAKLDTDAKAGRFCDCLDCNELQDAYYYSGMEHAVAMYRGQWAFVYRGEGVWEHLVLGE